MTKKKPAELFRSYLASERAEMAEIERKRKVAEAERLERIAAAERERMEKETRFQRARLEAEARRRVETENNVRCQAKARLELLKLLSAVKAQSQFVRIDGIDRPLAPMFTVVVSHFDKKSSAPKEIWSISARFVKPRAGADLGIVVGRGRRFGAINELTSYFDHELLRDMAKHVAICEAIRKQDGLRIAPAPVQTRSGHSFGARVRRYGDIGCNLLPYSLHARIRPERKRSLTTDDDGSTTERELPVESEYLLAADENLADSMNRAVRKLGYESDAVECVGGEMMMFMRSKLDYWETRERVTYALSPEHMVEGEWCLLPVGAAGWASQR